MELEEEGEWIVEEDRLEKERGVEDRKDDIDGVVDEDVPLYEVRDDEVQGEGDEIMWKEMGSEMKWRRT